MLLNVAAKDIDNALAEVANGQIKNHLVGGREGESDVGMCQGNAFKLRIDIGQFRVVAFQKLTPGRNIEEEIAHQKVGSHRAGDGFLLLKFRAFDLHTHSQFLIGHSCAEFHLSHCRD